MADFELIFPHEKEPIQDPTQNSQAQAQRLFPEEINKTVDGLTEASLFIALGVMVAAVGIPGWRAIKQDNSEKNQRVLPILHEP